MQDRNRFLRISVKVAILLAGHPCSQTAIAQSLPQHQEGTTIARSTTSQFDEYGELQAIDPQQVPILATSEYRPQEDRSSWSNPTAKSLLDGPGPLPSPRPLSSMISDSPPTDGSAEPSPTEAGLCIDVTNGCGRLIAPPHRHAGPKLAPAIMLEVKWGNSMG